MPPSPLIQPVLSALHELLKPLNYRKAGNVFTRKINDVFHLIELQGSQQSTAVEAKYTVNVAVFVPELIYEDVREFRKPSVSAAHFRERLGILASEASDVWWRAATPTDAECNAKDICFKLSQCALPRLKELSSASALAVLWSQGFSPGITEGQRKEYLAQLTAVPKNAP